MKRGKESLIERLKSYVTEMQQVSKSELATFLFCVTILTR